MARPRAGKNDCWLELCWNTARDAVFWFERGRLRTCNPAAEALLQREVNSITGCRESDILEREHAGKIVVHRPDGTRAVCTLTRQTVRNPAGILLVLRDVTDYEELERSLGERNAQLLSTIESIPFDFWMNDTENRTILQNPVSRRLWGDQTGHHMREVTRDESILKTWEATNARALQGETVVGEITYTFNGRRRIFRNVVAPVRTDREIIGILGLNLEITDLKEALEDRDRLLRELHHLVRNDLQIILSTLNLHRTERILSAPEVLRRVTDQVQAICLVHEQLYTGSATNTIDLSEVGRGLAPRPAAMEPGGPVLCPIERAIPAAILLTELLAWVTRNSGQGGAITVQSGPSEEIILGVEGPASRTSPQPSRPGEEPAVVRGLLEQLGGTMTSTRETSVSVRVSIPSSS